MDIKQLFEKHSNQIFLKSSDQKESFKDFYHKVSCVAFELKIARIQSGDVVLIIDVPPDQFPSLFFAICSIEAIAFPLSNRLTHKQLEEVSKSSNARFIVSKKNLSFIGCMWINPDKFNQSKADIREDNYWDIQIPATFIQTSGSSGQPKLAVHSLKNHFSNALAVNSFFKISQEDNWLIALPLYHVAGLALLFRCVSSGATLSLPRGNLTLEENIGKSRPSHISMVPAQLWKLLESNSAIDTLKSCKAIFLGGSSIPASLLQKSLDFGLNIYTSYGLTETSSTVAIKKIIDISTDDAEILPCFKVITSNEREVLLKGEPLFLGYYVGNKTKNGCNKEGWFATNDLGIVENSKLTIVGRKDNMFISGGENIYPEEIEKELLKISYILQVIVVPKTDPEYGERPVAFLDTKKGFSSIELKDLLKKNLASFKIPDSFLPWPKDLKKSELKVDRSYFKSLA